MSSNDRFKFYAAAFLVLLKDGQVLLHKRQNTGYQDGNYSLVSGHFEFAETAKQCTIREAKEEANVDIRPDDLTVSHVMHRFRPDRTYMDVYLTCNAWDGKVTNMEKETCEELKWFPIDDLPDNLIPEVKLALENIQKKIHYSEFGW